MTGFMFPQLTEKLQNSLDHFSQLEYFNAYCSYYHPLSSSSLVKNNVKLAFCLFNYYPFGGLERDFLRIASACAERGDESHVYTLSWEGDKPQSLHIHLIPKKGLSNHRRAMAFVRQVLPRLADENFDAVIGFNRMPGLDLYFGADLCFTKTAMAKHGVWFRLTSRYRHYRTLESALFSPNSKTKILTLSDAVKSDYQSYYKTSDDRFIHVPPGIKKMDLDFIAYNKLRKEYRDALSIDDDEMLLLQVASNFKLKGLDRSLQAIANLPQEILSKIKFYVIGKGRCARFMKLAKKLGINDKVNFLGGRENIQNTMLAADLLLHPAHFETAGMVIIEALTCGLPVIVTENCGYAFHVERARAGKLLSAPFQQKQLNDTVIKCLTSNNRATLQQNALNYAMNTDLYSLVVKVMSLIDQGFHKSEDHSD